MHTSKRESRADSSFIPSSPQPSSSSRLSGIFWGGSGKNIAWWIRPYGMFAWTMALNIEHRKGRRRGTAGWQEGGGGSAGTRESRFAFTENFLSYLTPLFRCHRDFPGVFDPETWGRLEGKKDRADSERASGNRAVNGSLYTGYE